MKDDSDQATRIEAAVFRRLLDHLDSRKDVQNIELMNLAGFCRNCLAKWYGGGRSRRAVIDYDRARERVWHALRRVERQITRPRGNGG